MKRGSFQMRPWATTAILTLGLAACTGSTGPAGPPGTPAVDRGNIAGFVKDASGAPVAAATVSTDPATVTAQTDGAGGFTLSSIPVGAYRVGASKAGYADGSITGVGVGAGGTVNVSLVLAAVPPTVGSISGSVLGRKGTSGASSPVAGATVCLEGASPPQCATSQADGTYTLSGVAPGFPFLSASATGFLPGETREAIFLAAGATVGGVDVTLSGAPTSTATYLGSSACIACHTGVTPGIVSAWQASAHASAIVRGATEVDPTAWAGVTQESNCTSTANAHDVGFTAPDPRVATAPFEREVFLVHYAAACTPAFAMALDTNQNGVVDPADTIMPVTATAGGVATGAGQCGNGGILPASALCSEGSSGWWQQEYLMGIGGASKPAWVTWDTTNASGDMLVLPAAWNQRARAWVAAPDYYPSFSSATPPNPRDGTYSRNCSGCHETGLSLATDANGNVTSYGAKSTDIGCEKCHGPGSSHQAAGGDAQFIVNPGYLTAQSEREVCGQCHSQGVASASPAGVFGFAWNDAAAAGGGNFIPGVHILSDFQSAPAFGDPDFYWPSGFPSSDHETFIDFGANVHANNPFEKVACANCHSGHGGTGGPVQIQKTSAAGAVYAFQNNDAVLRDDVACLVCHATFGPFATVALEDVANYHIMEGGAVTKGGTAMAPTADVQAASESLIASAVNGHMMDAAKMPAYFDPTGAASGMPVGRCSSCHLAKTAFTGTYFSGPDAMGRTANVIGDVSAHTFKVAWPDMSLATWAAATTWDGVMPNACGSCHVAYRFGK